MSRTGDGHLVVGPTRAGGRLAPPAILGGLLVPPRVVPTVRRRRLAELLKQARTQAGLSIEEVAARFEWSESKIYRVERAAHGISVSDARLLLDLYGVSGRQAEEVLELVRDAKERGWWHSYTDVLPEPYAAFVGLEQ